MLFRFDGADVLFDGSRSSVNEFLGIHQAKAGDGLDGFDDSNFGASADALEDERDFARSLGSASVFCFSRSGGNSRGSGDAEGFFDEFNEVIELENGVLLQAFDDLFFGEFSHC